MTGRPVVNAAGQPLAHESAVLHVSGRALYTDDIGEIAGTLYLALGPSEKARATISALDLAPVRAATDVHAVIVAADIPGRNDCGPIVADDPILADGEVRYVGQPIFAVAAGSQLAARRAARLAKVRYDEQVAVLAPAVARAAGDGVCAPMRLARGDVDAALAAATFRRQGRLSVGGQEQFYLEGQISYAVPAPDGTIQVWCSTQHPSEMQHLIARCLGIAHHRVTVSVRRMGGGFGGKESQSALFACVAAVAAVRTGRPCKLRLDRDDDFCMTGKRHPFEYRYEAGFDAGGRLAAWRLDMTSNAGFSADLSPPVASRAICTADNAYFVPNADLAAFAARTNVQSNTAFRGFGGPQGAFAIEYVLDDIARDLGVDPLTIRRRNLYGAAPRNLTPYGQPFDDNVLPALIDQLVISSDYRARREACRAANASQPVLRRGIALTPVKFGISFNMVHFNQAGALVHIYTDGSVLVNHGGTEMGQGLNTKVAQVVAGVLGLPIERVAASATDTGKIANTPATAASSGFDLNGKAAEAAALELRRRLSAVAARMIGDPDAAFDFIDGRVVGRGESLPGSARTVAFDAVVAQAHRDRVQLWADGFYATPGLSWDPTTMTGRPFYYFACGAAVSEVLIDSLTGEMRLLRADLLHDCGRSINPALDRGQIEGGFIQGMGWLTQEELVWSDEGRLLTHAPSTYKIPSVNDCPPDLRVTLFDAPNRADTIHRSRAVGEPPLLLSFSVFFAIRDAIASVADYRRHPPLCPPATAEAILAAVEAIAG
jgi:xanthine dehydrogenase large subunit